jgi:hypothetical protein
MRKLALLAIYCLTLAAHGQTPASPQPAIRYHFGDNFEWADPAFDDSSWPRRAEWPCPLPLPGLTAFTIPQVPGSLPRSHAADGVDDLQRNEAGLTNAPLRRDAHSMQVVVCLLTQTGRIRGIV